MVTTTATSATSSTNLDVNGIVTQLMAVERQPLNKLNAQEASYQAKLSAFGMLSGAMSTFQSSVLGLSNPSLFQALKATPSDTTVFSASTASTAVPGSYTLDVTTLAQAQKLVAAGQTSSTAAIGTGASTTLTFDFGTISGGTYTAYNPATNTGGTYAGSTFTSNGSGLKTVTINSTNNSLQGIRDAINAAAIGVTAAIVNDGSGTPYRLTLTSNSMGVSNSLNIAVSGDAAISSLLTNNPGTVAAVAGSVTAASTPKVATGTVSAAAGSIAAGALVVTTAAGSANVGAITLPGGTATANGTAIAAAISAALASLPGGAVANGTAADNGAGVITWTTGTNGANTLSMGGFAADSATATTNQTTLITQTGFDAAQLGTQAIGAQHMAQSAVAQNAVFNVNGVQVTKTSNTVSDVIQGVTLNLLKPATGATLSIARDTAATTTAITGFVKAYNDLAKTLADSSAYNAATKQGATLQGNPTVRTLQSQLRNLLSASVSGTAGTVTTLSQVGITFQKDGSLALDSTKLNTAMTNYPNDIGSLFASVGKGTDSLVSFNAATSTTKPGNYAVNITQLATMGSTLGNAVVPASGNVIASGDTISVTLDGVTATVALTAGTYTNTQLATMIQSAINGTSAFSTAGSSVAATISGSNLSISSTRYGSTSNVSMTDVTGTAVATYLGGAPTNTTGVNVAGSIGGVSATGSGQLLSVASGDPQGLSIIVNGGSLGARGSLNYSQGYATTLNRWSTAVMASDGSITSATNGINKTIQDIAKRRDALNVRLVSVEARYRAQFTHLDAMLSSMNTTSTFLTQQLSKL